MKDTRMREIAKERRKEMKKIDLVFHPFWKIIAGVSLPDFCYVSEGIFALLRGRKIPGSSVPGVIWQDEGWVGHGTYLIPFLYYFWDTGSPEKPDRQPRIEATPEGVVR